MLFGIPVSSSSWIVVLYPKRGGLSLISKIKLPYRSVIISSSQVNRSSSFTFRSERRTTIKLNHPSFPDLTGRVQLLRRWDSLGDFRGIVFFRFLISKYSIKTKTAGVGTLTVKPLYFIGSAWSWIKFIYRSGVAVIPSSFIDFPLDSPRPFSGIRNSTSKSGLTNFE